MYPKDEFTALARRAAAASRSNPQARAFVRALAASSDEQRPDAQGRIMLSAEHRRYANLSKDCVVIGSVDFLEIWDKTAWDSYLAEHEEDYSQARDESLGGIF
ncbi:cell division protein MraZ [Nocardia seriolae]|nr:cell division protein MraZ [Nocardia seriolae]